MPLLAALAVVMIGFILLIPYYNKNLKGNISLKKDSFILQIPDSTSFATLIDSFKVNNLLNDYTTFEKVAKEKNYGNEQFVRSGRFKLKNGMNNVKLVRLLKVGNQEPVNVVLNNERMIENVAAKIAKFVQSDSVELLNHFTNPTTLSTYKCTIDDILTCFIPNTYQCYWNLKPHQILERLNGEKEKFWNKNDRLKKAAEMGFTPKEIYIIASIVEKETAQNAEKSTIAGLYINRLKTGMKLQADPTAVFATKDFATKRVTQQHTMFDSPFNTYFYEGLPPGPICMPSITTIDAVLKAEKHNYIFMCARPDYSGRHAFAETLQAHNQNAIKYQNWLTQKGL